MKYTAITLLCSIFCIVHVSAQYLGGENASGFNVTASDEHQDSRWSQPALAANSINGAGMNSKYYDAFRFLTQATIAFEPTHVQDLLSFDDGNGNIDFEAWIDDQFSKSLNSILNETNSIKAFLENHYGQTYVRPDWTEFNYAWWEMNMTNDDLLRHKVAAALSEILVISRNSELGGYGDALASYYDILLSGAFGNYRQILEEVTLHPAMGFYLSHLNNPKTDSIAGIHPDENYAREVMQLFTIGLYELNHNGTRKAGDIPTYDNDDIKEFAKIFTGLGVAQLVPEVSMYCQGAAQFGDGIYCANMTVPMQMWNNEHEPGSKTLLNGYTTNASNTGMQDIEDALDHLFNHANTAPFISYRLIQRLVKSNPSPAYVDRVADAFDGNGPYGTSRGDMQSIIKAILLDPEARSASFQLDDSNSKLKEPLFKYTQFVRYVDKVNPGGRWWNIGYGFYEATRQAILASPTVFNFFKPTDTPNGPISNMGLVAPEFKIHDSRTSIEYANEAYAWTWWEGNLIGTWEDGLQDNANWDFSALLPIADDAEAYINWLDDNILGGEMTDKTRSIMRAVMSEYQNEVSWHNHRENRVKIGMYLALTSREYSIIN